MSGTLDPVGAAPEARSPSFLLLLFGTSAAPLFWSGQVILGYAVSAQTCYPGDHPLLASPAGPLSATLMLFDAMALIACLAGGIVSWLSWRRLSVAVPAYHAPWRREGRDRFLAVWGLFSSLWFFFAILFNIIASLTVPPCLG